MGFQDQAGSLFSVGLVAVAIGGTLLPMLHPFFDVGEGGVGSDEAGSLTGSFVGESLTDKTLRNCEIRDSVLLRVEAHGCRIFNSEIVDSRIRGGSVSGGTGRLSAFKGGSVTGGSFENVTVDGTAIADATVHGLIMTGGSLKGVTLTGGTLENVAIEGGRTKWVTMRSTKAEASSVAKDATILESSVANYTLQGGRAESSTLINTRRDGTDVVSCDVREADLVVRKVATEGGKVVVTVGNTGSAAAGYFEVVLYTGDAESGRTLVRSVPAGGETRVTFPLGSGGALRAVADATDRVPEPNEGNNEGAG